MVHDLLQRITELGDQAVILPIVAGVAVLLVVQGRRAASAAWLVDAGAVLSVVLLGKLLFLGCAWRLGSAGPSGLWPRSPSGHTASTAMVVGNITMLVVGGSTVRRVGLASAASLAAAGLTSVSRVALGAHTIADVVAGGIIGFAGTLAFGLYLLPWLEGERTVVPRPGWSFGLLVVVAAVGVLVSGRHLAVEATIIRMANDAVRSYIPMCYRA